jgi:hypothetical protein
MSFPQKPPGSRSNAPRKKAVVGAAMSRQHPAVVLRAQFNQVRALLAVALIAAGRLKGRGRVLATDDDAGTATRATTTSAPAGSTRHHDGAEGGARM